MDNNYFVLRISEENSLKIYFYNHNSFKYLTLNYPICFNLLLNQDDQVIHLLSIYEPVNKCSTLHKLYLGKEIFKAQLAIHFNQYYIQD
uniref:DUF4346 domain-containing protein n=1 Tax=Melanothamnus harveyi TaxID=397005 RepID=A0A1Z1MHU1_MELHR|nr:hypothetical protein [Melanothamnus harveyi]ARW65432.1 hypothetical protein [Melanothamnus harveyi]